VATAFTRLRIANVAAVEMVLRKRYLRKRGGQAECAALLRFSKRRRDPASATPRPSG
jgi:hypothetical protein